MPDGDDLLPPWMERLEAHRDLAGTVPDSELARLAGVSTSVARTFRTRLGRPATRRVRAALPPEPAPRPDRLPPLAARAPERPAEEVIAANADRLDTLPDWMLARELRVSVAEIEAFRAARSRPRSNPPAPASPAPRKPRSRPSSAPPAPAPTPSAPPRPATGEDRIAAVSHLVGRLADIHVAEAAGVSVADVVAWRKKHRPAGP